MEIKKLFSKQVKKADPIKISSRQLLLFKMLGILPFLGILFVIVCSLNYIPFPFINGESNQYSYVVTIGYGLLIGGSAYVGGAFIGFLFGLPRYLSNPDSPNKNYSRNDNLIQISDWLTKIIVGLGLTNLYKIPGLIESFGASTSVLFGNGGAGSVGAALAECILIYFLVCGFLLGYLWTNLQYIPILTEMDLLATNLIEEKRAQVKAANAAIDSYTSSLNSGDPNVFSTIEEKQRYLPEGAKILSSDDYAAILQKARQKMQTGMQLQSSLPDDQKDPNKNQWGGKATNNNRAISASVTEIAHSELFLVTLTVNSTDPANPIIDGSVILFTLHNTFTDPYKIVFVKESKAILEFISFGAFTVGVICDDGVTELEYDLAALPTAPSKFINS